MNCCVVPVAMDAFAGVTEIETSAGAMVILNDPLAAPIFAVIEQVPAAFAVSMPPLDTVATVLSDEAHVAELVRSCDVPVLYAPVAFICCVWPTMRLAFEPDT